MNGKFDKLIETTSLLFVLFTNYLSSWYAVLKYYVARLIKGFLSLCSGDIVVVVV